MYKYKKYSLSLIVLFGLLSCSKSLMKSNEGNNYIPYSEVIEIKQVSINHASVKSVISEFLDDVKIFEHGVNSYSPYKIDYFILVDNFCKNDSLFISLKATANIYLLFYGLDDFLDERWLEQFRVAQVDERYVLIRNEKSQCADNRKILYKELNQSVEFTLNWYKKSNGDRLITLSPYFFKTYLFDKGEIEYVELSFPDLIQELK